ncbi:prealbumin-like fold domain-containing protein [Enterococcus malodoratus]|uniref:prealbumin-like fold domain-containing protein n=1 Tax=Enterococcus malodoratus TaxID=71451 RepID=UPI003FD25C0C
MKDFILEVNKKDNLNKPLSGASFRLRGIGGNTYNKLITTGPTFTFGELRPGRYLLSEEDAPNGFTGLTEDIEIIITDSGLVGVDPKGQVDLVEEGWGMITDSGNIIKITVRNNPARAGQAPRTGGQGNKKMMMVSIGLVGTSALAGICYFFLNRKNW